MKIVKNNSLLHAQPIEEAITAPGPDGEPIEIARPGDYATWAETEDGWTWKGVLTETELREKHRKVG